MSPQRFEALLQKVGPLISKQDTQLRKAVPAGERLAITIRYLATGDSQLSLPYAFRRGRSTISNIISETCPALWDVLSVEYLKAPSGNDWKGIANDFEKQWNIPGCIGALDGKHICIECPKIWDQHLQLQKLPQHSSYGNVRCQLLLYFGGYWWLWKG